MKEWVPGEYELRNFGGRIEKQHCVQLITWSLDLLLRMAGGWEISSFALKSCLFWVAYN